ncbi:hypothetical protein Csa_019590 [Cucumis sativus]|uniref:Uncharacterized protein n=3 Tax=Cucumis TaxID=3655 RepID=A0A5A7TXU3_CUCMM|nr:hypothetical protein E6C27_scaffold216G00760 [Cucumis melo var. makuwa]KGN65314.1 hypothetical protein Csa_019590 [Cucumis sativus]TYK29661.1 hypothetical protein E5676_scaffold64G00030 [Cucumis melo var. makuwa]
MGAKRPLKEKKETPVAIKPQWSLGPISSAAQPTKHKSGFKKRETEKSKPKPLKGMKK